MNSVWLGLSIAGLATAGVIIRPFRIPEYLFALGGAVLLVALGLLPWPLAWGAVLKGVDLGPNLSVTGSLATILWLTALRKENLHVSAWQFLRVGLIVMPPALILALGVLAATHACG